MINTKIVIALFLIIILSGCFGGGGNDNTGPSNPPTTQNSSDTTTTQPPANSSPVISFTPSGTPTANSVYLEKTLTNNDEITLAVKVKGGTDVYGAALWLTYDESKIKYVSSSSSGSYLGSDLTFSFALLNNQEGTLLLGTNKKGNTAGTNGDGALLTITFKALTTQSNTQIGFNSTNSMLKSSTGNINGVNWIGGGLSHE